MPPAETGRSEAPPGARTDYLPALDGIRALAILLVVAFHAKVPGFGNGRVGVDVFFVLSGYLITNILLNGRGLGAFYLGRARRLIPAYLAMLATVVLLGPILLPPDPDALWDAVFAAAYLTDLWAPAVNQKGALLHTWSLALEMQFYLVWPFILQLRRAWLAPVLWAGWLALTLARFVVLADAGAVDPLGLSPLRASGMILGALLALSPLPPARWCVAAGLALLIVAACGMNASAAWAAAGLTLAELAAVLLITGARGPWPTSLASPVLVRLGVLSYGLYLWHYPLVVMARPWGDVAALVVSFGGGLVLAALSLRVIEAPFRAGAGRIAAAAAAPILTNRWGTRP